MSPALTLVIYANLVNLKIRKLGMETTMMQIYLFGLVKAIIS